MFISLLQRRRGTTKWWMRRSPFWGEDVLKGFHQNRYSKRVCYGWSRLQSRIIQPQMISSSPRLRGGTSEVCAVLTLEKANRQIKIWNNQFKFTCNTIANWFRFKSSRFYISTRLHPQPYLVEGFCRAFCLKSEPPEAPRLPDKSKFEKDTKMKIKQSDINPFSNSDSNKRYYTYDYYLRKTFGGKCMKIPLDAGYTCPNIDGKCSVGGCI